MRWFIAVATSLAAALALALLWPAFNQLLLALCLGFLGLQLLTLLSNLGSFPVLEPNHSKSSSLAIPSSAASKNAEAETSSDIRVSILIPARNEILSLPETLPRILEQQSSGVTLEVLVLDDESDDGTGTWLADYPQQAALRVLSGKRLPPGWGGKNWACWQLAQAAQGDILIFTDADVYWEAGTLAALLAFRAEQQAEYVSVWPRQQVQGIFERLTVPLIDNILLGALPYLGVKYLPWGAFSAGNGQLMLWQRRLYQRIGGHEAVKAEVLEDVRMGQRAKASGAQIALALGGNMLSTRMYRSAEEVIGGFSKNIFAAHSYSYALMTSSLLLNSLSYSAAWLLLFVHPGWALVIALGWLQRGLSCHKSRRTWLEFPLQSLMAYALWRIVYRAMQRPGAYQWKGRSYS